MVIELPSASDVINTTRGLKGGDFPIFRLTNPRLPTDVKGNTNKDTDIFSLKAKNGKKIFFPIFLSFVNKLNKFQFFKGILTLREIIKIFKIK